MEEFNYDLSYSQNRELSWLEFNKRVLLEAAETDVPPIEKLKFISIFTSNLDEFFMVRVGSLSDLEGIKDVPLDNKSGMSISQQLEAIYQVLPSHYQLRDQLFNEVERKLSSIGIKRCDYQELSQDDIKFVDKYYEDTIQPILSPMILDPSHPFPFMDNKELVIFAEMTNGEDEILGIVPIPRILDEILILPKSEGVSYILTEDIISGRLEEIFSFNILNFSIISTTRNADLNLEEEMEEYGDDYRKVMKKALKKRKRLQPVRLEVKGKLSKGSLDYLCEFLQIGENQIFHSKSPLVLSYPFSLEGAIPEELEDQVLFKAYEPLPSVNFNTERPIMDQIMEKDRLLHFPYESMDPFIQLLKEAANDPEVLSIKITIYRLSSISKVAEYLSLASENGKDVVALMELRARFDEDNNINWSERLEESGCTVIYGFKDYKVHSKICQITKSSPEGIKHITQIGTGNYNEKTAKQYTDLSFMTADPVIGEDANSFFRNMLLSNLQGNYEKLLVAPSNLRSTIFDLIDQEIDKAKMGQGAMIRIKCNSVTERELIDKLAEASQAGVQIYLNIRGICCILPGIKGKTDNIQVTSILGRYLEHPRIYIFGHGPEAEVFISSSDLMTRNLSRRVEIAAPIEDLQVKKEILDIMTILLEDNKKSRTLCPDGIYIRPVVGERSAQAEFMEITQEKYEQYLERKKEADMQIIIDTEEKMIEKAISKMSFFDKLKILFINK